jgi:hypothetical protein
MEQQMFKSPNGSRTSDRELRFLTDNELELVSGGAINEYGDASYDRMLTKLAGESGGGNASPANLVRAGMYMAIMIGLGMP